MEQYSEVDVSEKGFFNLLFIHAEIQGLPVIGMFDTGAGITVIKQSLFRKMGAAAHADVVRIGNNHGAAFERHTIVIPSLKMGKEILTDIRAVVMEDEAFAFGTDEKGQTFPADLLIGWDVISQYAWKCDMRTKSLLIQSGGSHGKANDLSWHNFPLIHVHSGRYHFVAGLDTGHTDTMLDQGWENRFKDLSCHSENMVGVGSSATCQVKSAKQFDVTYQAWQISLQDIDIVEQIHGAPEEMEALLGIDFLQNARWEMDFLSGYLKIE